MVGLKTCLPRTRKTNLLPMAIAAASGGTHSASVRRSSDRPSALMIGERNPVEGSPSSRSSPHCSAQVEARSTGGIQRSICKPQAGHPQDEEAGEEGDLQQARVAGKQPVERGHRPP